MSQPRGFDDAPPPAAPAWRTPAAWPALAAGEVHVWRAHLDQWPADREPPEALLSPDERSRFSAFRFERDAVRFARRRAVLRRLLAGYTGAAPDRLVFTHNAFGKPFLAESAEPSPAAALEFSASHSHGMALIAVARGWALGVDIERIRAELADEAIAQRFFAPEEVRALEALQGDERTAAFFACWTCKEAYVKGVGMGLSLPLDGFEVALPPQPLRLQSTQHDPAQLARWSLHAIDAHPGFAAALAIEGSGRALRCWDWPAD